MKKYIVRYPNHGGDTKNEGRAQFPTRMKARVFARGKTNAKIVIEKP